MNETNIQEVERFLGGIIDKTNDMKPIMHTIGEKFHSKSMGAFEKERDPISGIPWSPVSSDTTLSQAGGKRRANTKKGKQRVADKRILRDSGDLQDSVDYTASKDSLEFVAPKEYAATHFFGDKKRNIKQRRYLPFTDDLDLDDNTTNEVLEDIGNFIVDS